MNRKNYILILILMFLSVFTQAQTEEASYRYEGGKVYMHVPMSLDSLRIDSILENIESSLAICDSLDQVDSKFTVSGWEMTAYESGYIEYSKTIKNLKGDAKENLIILDEPNSNLDSAGEKALLACLQELKKQGKTIVLVTHKTNLLAVSDKTLMLVNGTVEKFGPTREMFQAAPPGGAGGAQQPPQQPAVVNLASPTRAAE